MSRARRRPATAPTEGSVLAGRYRLDRLLGEGGMAEVYASTDLTAGRRVAVKVLRPDIADNAEAVERIKREGQLLTELKNPAIVSAERFDQLEDGTVYLVMELLEGETLGERTRRGPMDPAELAPIVAGTCAGLHAAHTRGIVHRDLKPDNVFLCPTEQGDLQVKLLDFGISKVFGGDKLTNTGEVLGTPRYMSPEQLGAEPDVDARADVYALGVMLYEALAGRPPFLATTPTDLIVAILHGKVAPLRSARPDVSPQVEEVVMRAMAKVRGARFDTAMQLAEAYVDAVGGPRALRGQAKRGMATRALGGMKAGDSTRPPVPDTRPPPPSKEADEVAGNLHIGTFSGMSLEPPGETTLAARPAVKAEKAALERAATMPQSAVRDVPATREQPIEPPVIERSVPATAMIDMSGAFAAIGSQAAPIARPHQGLGGAAKALLVVGALLAGAATTAAVIAGMRWYDRKQAQAEDRSGAAAPDAGTAHAVGAAAIAGDAGTDASATEVATTDLPVPALDPAPEPSLDPATPRRPRGNGNGNGEARARPDAGQAPLTPGEALSQAQDALRAGNPQRCVDMLNGVLGRAPVVALRRRAACLDALGQRSAAIDDLCRFTRLSDDAGAVAEVRQRLDGWGAVCH